MFGYVTADLASMSEDDLRIYRAAYCGVCRSLHSRYGLRSTLALTYDVVFLALLLDAMEDKIGKSTPLHCLLHPLEKRSFLSDENIDYAADMGVILTYYKLLDDWQDDKDVLRLTESHLIKRAAETATLRYPRQSERIISCLKELAQMEKEDVHIPDLPAACFGAMMGEMFLKDQNEFAPLLWETGSRLGKFIYLCDAVCDLKADLKKKRYNPLTSQPSQDMVPALCLQMHACTACYEKLPIKRYRTLLDNILFSGVWANYKKHIIKEQKQMRPEEGKTK